MKSLASKVAVILSIIFLISTVSEAADPSKKEYSEIPVRFIVKRNLKGNSPAQTTNANISTVTHADMPLMDLIKFIVADLDKYWRATFTASGWYYNPPKGIEIYYEEMNTPCGKTLLGNASYCSADHKIYLDYNLANKYYREIGDFTTVIILGHEWGHAIQSQIGATKSRFLNIQLELQADCLCGAYSKNASERGIVEEDDPDEGVSGLFQLKDPKGIPWLSSNAHGKGYQRINSFLDGLKGGAFACGFYGNLVGVWDAEITESGYRQQVTWQANANGTDTTWFSTPYGQTAINGRWQYVNGTLYQQTSTGAASGTIKWIDANHIEVTIIQNQEGLSSRGRTRQFYRRRY